MVAQIAAREKRFQHAHGQRGHNPHACCFQVVFPFAAEKRVAAHRIGQNGAFHAALCRIAHRGQQRLNPALRFDNVKRQCAGLTGRLDICQHGLKDFVRLRQKLHGVVVARRQAGDAGCNVGNALVTAAHFIVRVQIFILEMPLGKLVVKRVHLFHALGSCHPQTRLAHQQIGRHAEQWEDEQDHQPCKRRARIALAVQHAYGAHRYRRNMEAQEYLSRRNAKHSCSVKRSGRQKAVYPSCCETAHIGQKAACTLRAGSGRVMRRAACASTSPRTGRRRW